MKLMRSLFLLVGVPLAVSGCAANPGAMAMKRIDAAGPVRWDYPVLDPVVHRLYVAHLTQTEIIDTRSDTVVGQLAGTNGVHGIAIARDLGVVFTSDGADGDIGVYDLRTQQRLRSIKAGKNPDAIVYEPLSQRVLAFNGGSNDVTLADAKTGQVIAASIAVGGKPEFAVVGADAKVYFNIEDTSEIGVIDARTSHLIKRYPIAPCAEPTGLAIDPAGRLYSVCGNGVMVVSDPASGRVIGQAPIGLGSDGVVWTDGRAISANGQAGTATVVVERSPGDFVAQMTWQTALGARTVAVDASLHKLYFPTADFAPAEPAAASAASAKPRAVPGSFHLLVLPTP